MSIGICLIEKASLRRFSESQEVLKVVTCETAGDRMGQSAEMHDPGYVAEGAVELGDVRHVECVVFKAVVGRAVGI